MVKGVYGCGLRGERVRDRLVELLELLHEETEIGLRVVVVDVSLAIVVEALVDGVALAEVEGPLIRCNLLISLGLVVLSSGGSRSRSSDSLLGSLLRGLGRLLGLASRLLRGLLGIRELLLRRLLLRLLDGLLLSRGGLLRGLRLRRRRALKEGEPRGAALLRRRHDVLGELPRVTEHARHGRMRRREALLAAALAGYVLGYDLLLDGLTDLLGPRDPPGGLLLRRVRVLLLLRLCGLRSGLEGLESGLHNGPAVGQGERVDRLNDRLAGRDGVGHSERLRVLECLSV